MVKTFRSTWWSSRSGAPLLCIFEAAGALLPRNSKTNPKVTAIPKTLPATNMNVEERVVGNVVRLVCLLVVAGFSLVLDAGAYVVIFFLLRSSLFFIHATR